ncbi:hypothetical protein KY347_00090 [Candidatus Woesearchaeota archaeon]|nr:hypothetical protein [Candidatus Woesearchaeota archaeon]
MDRRSTRIILRAIEQNYFLRRDPLSYIERGYKSGLNSIQESLINLESAVRDLREKADYNSNILEQMDREQWDLGRVWNFLVETASNYGIKTWESTRGYILNIEEDMSPEQKEQEKEALIGIVRERINWEHQLSNIILNMGRPVIRNYKIGIAEFSTFMEVKPAVTEIFEAAKTLTRTGVLMYAGCEVPLNMVRESIKAIQVVTEAGLMLEDPKYSNSTLEELVSRSKELEASRQVPNGRKLLTE